MYKCSYCGAKKENGADIYVMENGSNAIVPVCSEKCANRIKDRELQKLKEKK